MALGRLTDLIEKGIELTKINPFYFVLRDDYELQDYIIYLNTEEQLYKGKDATGEDLENIGGAYTEFTVAYKQAFGQPYDRVTLKNEGLFYKSFDVEIESDMILIDAYYLKEGDKGMEDLRDRWGQDLAGLTTESRAKLIEKLLPKLRLFILEFLLSN
jgi:hypothetical protein